MSDKKIGENKQQGNAANSPVRNSPKTSAMNSSKTPASAAPNAASNPSPATSLMTDGIPSARSNPQAPTPAAAMPPAATPPPAATAPQAAAVPQASAAPQAAAAPQATTTTPANAAPQATTDTTPTVSATRSSGQGGKIFVSRPDIPQSALDILKEFELDIWDDDIPVPRDEFLERIDGVSALYIYPLDRVDAEALESAGKNLKVIGTLSAGYDHIDVAEAKKRGIKIGCTNEALKDAVAELTIGILLQVSRRIFEGRAQVSKGRWRKWSPWTWMNGFGLKDSVVGIFGLGKIGMEIGRRIIPFKPAKILYTSREANPQAAEIKAEKVDLDRLLQESDFVILSCSLNDSTRKIINAHKLSLMKSTSFLVNVSRGDVIDQDALITALRKRQIRGAALDVTTPEPLSKKSQLLKLNNCVVVPHLGSAEYRTRLAMAETTSRNILAGLKGTKLPEEI